MHNIDFYLALSSPWTYLSMKRVLDISIKYKVKLNLKPVNVADIFNHNRIKQVKQRPEAVQINRLNELEQIFKKQAENMNKPAKVVEGIVKGKIRKELQEICLLEQPFVKEQKKSVQQIINNVAKEAGSSITVSEYVYFKVGDKIT